MDWSRYTRWKENNAWKNSDGRSTRDLLALNDINLFHLHWILLYANCLIYKRICKKNGSSFIVNKLFQQWFILILVSLITSHDQGEVIKIIKICLRNAKKIKTTKNFKLFLNNYMIHISFQYLANVQGQPIQNELTSYIDCKGKDFHCVDSKNFLLCVDDNNNGQFRTINNVQQSCRGALFCDNSYPYECSSTVDPSATTRQPQTTTTPEAETLVR